MLNIKEKIRNLPIQTKVSVAFIVCSVVQKFLSIITLPLFTRLLTTEQYGQLSIYTSWSAIIGLFTTLNMPYGSMSAAMVKFEDRREDYIGVVQMFCIILSSLFLMIYLPLSSFFNKFLELPTGIVIIMIVEIFSSASIQSWMEKQKFEYKYKPIVAITLLVSFLAPMFALVLVNIFEERGYARIIGSAVIGIIFGLSIAIYNFSKSKKINNKEMWKFALSMNIPLLIYYLSQVVFNQSDRVMISHMCGLDKAGIYSIAYSFAMILNFVVNAINSSYLPWFYGKLKENNTIENRKITLLISLLIAILLIFVIWLAPEAVWILAGEKYVEAIWIVPPIAMCVLLLFYTQLSINVEFYYEKKLLLVLSSILSAVVNIVLNLLLIPKFGYFAAGYTTLISYVIFAVMNYIAMKSFIKKKNLQVKDMYNVPALLGLFAVFMLISFVGMMLYKVMWLRIAIIAIVCIIILINYKKVKKLVLNLIKKKEVPETETEELEDKIESVAEIESREELEDEQQSIAESEELEKEQDKETV